MEEKEQVLQWSYRVLGLDHAFPSQNKTFEEQRQQLAAYLNELIQNHFHTLVSILYRVDISREKLTKTLSENPNHQSAGEIIADLIIERQQEKVESRKKYKDL